MKSTKARFAKKLKSIRAVDYLKQDRVLRVISAADGLVDFLPKITNPIITQITNSSIGKVPQKLEEETIDVSNLLADEEDDEEASGSLLYDKENAVPPVNQNARDFGNCREARPEKPPRSDTCIHRTSLGSEFRRPDLNSSSLFDPKLLEAFERATEFYRRISRSNWETTTDEENLEKDENSPPEQIERWIDDGTEEEDAGNDRHTLAETSESGRDTEDEEAEFGKDENAPPEKIETQIEAGAEEEDAENDGYALPETSESGIDTADEEAKFGKEENTPPEKIERQIEAGAAEEDAGNDRHALPETSESVRETEDEEAELEKHKDTHQDPLLGFEERCPPGGEDSVVFYTTTLRGIRKTFDDCDKIRFLLDSFRVKYYERDVSMHREYKEELWRIMEGKKSTLPALFVKGKCIGGAQQVLSLHEQGKLRVLFEGVPITRTQCWECEGVRFLMCYRCRGSHKVICDDGVKSECLVCNENGLIVCPNCCL